MAHGLSRRQALLAAGLTATAGFVDGLAFIHLGGYFVSFMSGNSTRAGSDLVQGDPWGWAKAMGLVAFFVVGVVISSLVLQLQDRRRGLSPGNAPRTGAVWTSWALLVCSAVLAMLPGTQAAVPPVVAAAMGAVNSTFTRGGEVTVGLTYMTGTLVKTGQHLAMALTGGHPTAWLRFLVLWGAIALGALAGSWTYMQIGLSSLWVAVGLLTVPAVLLTWRSRTTGASRAFRTPPQRSQATSSSCHTATLVTSDPGRSETQC